MSDPESAGNGFADGSRATGYLLQPCCCWPTPGWLKREVDIPPRQVVPNFRVARDSGANHQEGVRKAAVVDFASTSRRSYQKPGPSDDHLFQ